MQIIDTKLEGVKILSPKIFGDQRGYLFESYREDEFHQKVEDITFEKEFEFHLIAATSIEYNADQQEKKSILIFPIRGDYEVSVFGKDAQESFQFNDGTHSQIYIPATYKAKISAKSDCDLTIKEHIATD